MVPYLGLEQNIYTRCSAFRLTVISEANGKKNIFQVITIAFQIRRVIVNQSYFREGVRRSFCRQRNLVPGENLISRTHRSSSPSNESGRFFLSSRWYGKKYADHIDSNAAKCRQHMSRYEETLVGELKTRSPRKRYCLALRSLIILVNKSSCYTLQSFVLFVIMNPQTV